MIALTSTAAPFIKVAFEEIGVSTLMFARFSIACLFLVPASGVNFKTWGRLLPVSTAGAISLLLTFYALDEMPASVVPVMFALTPALTLMYAAAAGKTRMSTRNIGAVAIAFVGVVILADVSSSTMNAPAVGLAALLSSVILYTAYGISSDKVQKLHPDISVKTMTFYMCLTTAVMASPLAIGEAFAGTAIGSPGVAHIAVLLHVALIATAGQFSLYQKAIKNYSAVAASLYLYIQIPINALLASILLGEPITLPLAGGSALMALGAFLVNQTDTNKASSKAHLRLARTRR